MVANIQSLHEDVLAMIVAFISQCDAGRLALTSRTMSAVARPRVLSSLRVATPYRSASFLDFILEEDGYRLQYMRKLAIPLWHTRNSADGYFPLAAVLVRAPNLRSLDVIFDSDRWALATEGGRALCDAIAALRDLHEFALTGITEDSVALCERMSCRPRVVRLEAERWTSEPLQNVEYAPLVHIPFLQNAAEAFMADLALLYQSAPEWSELPPPIPADLWPGTHTLRLRNMDPLVLVRLCPNLACLHIAFTLVGNSEFLPDDRLFRYTTSFAHDVAARLRVLEIFVNQQWSTLTETIVATVRATHPVVFSTQYYEGDREFWGRLAELFERSDARLRYLDVLMHNINTIALAHEWLDACLPLLSASNILCVRLRLVHRIERIRVGTPAPDLSPDAETMFRLDNSIREWLRDAAPRLLAEGIPTLRYVAVSSGYMVEDFGAPGCSSFRGRARWWRVVSESVDADVAEERAVELIEISAEEGQRLDEYMRSEAFAHTLQL